MEDKLVQFTFSVFFECLFGKMNMIIDRILHEILKQDFEFLGISLRLPSGADS